MLDYKNIPIFIISYNRLHCLKLLIESLEKKGYTNISIIDNQSSYPPLLDFLKKTKYHVFYMNQNYGHKVFWKNARFRKIVETQYYVLTDPDIVPLQQCPDDFMEQFYEILQQNPSVPKVGFSLKIDDLPEHYAFKEYVIKWEKQFYEKGSNYKNYKIYNADIDTTFALYRPNKLSFIADDCNFYKAIRTGYPYQARHLAWYMDSKNPSDEDIFYKERTLNGSSTWYDLSDEWKTIINSKKQISLRLKCFQFVAVKVFINVIPIASYRRKIRKKFYEIFDKR